MPRSQSVVSEIVMNAQSADETVSAVVWGPGQIAGRSKFAAYVEWSAGVASGVVQIETASHAAYAGTWSQMAGGSIANGTITFAGSAPNGQWFRIDGPILAVRARISTVVTGGTVTVTFVACD